MCVSLYNHAGFILSYSPPPNNLDLNLIQVHTTIVLNNFLCQWFLIVTSDLLDTHYLTFISVLS